MQVNDCSKVAWFFDEKKIINYGKFMYWEVDSSGGVRESKMRVDCNISSLALKFCYFQSVWEVQKGKYLIYGEAYDRSVR